MQYLARLLRDAGIKQGTIDMACAQAEEDAGFGGDGGEEEQEEADVADNADHVGDNGVEEEGFGEVAVDSSALAEPATARENEVTE